jgi:class 3 adenylate cyclase/predicted ATPase
MFCDLVQSTALSSRLDPEDLQDVIQAYHSVSADVLRRFEGSIAQYLGDGLLVYFGYPYAHEDDARRAIQAGLGLIEALGALNDRLEPEHGIRLAARIGIHTGLVVVGELGSGDRSEHLALGHTPNMAAWLQSLAEPNAVVISAATERLIQGLFVCQEQGLYRPKGEDQPVAVYRVLGQTEAQGPLDVAAQRGLTPFVGREEELALLRERWAQVRDGSGQVVLVSGEAGIGKSRLIQTFRASLGDSEYLALECRCAPYYQHTALYPAVDLLSRLLHWQRDDAPQAKLAKLEGTLQYHGIEREETVPILAALLALPLPLEGYARLVLTPQQQRRRTLDTLASLVARLARRQPVLLVVEDLHWSDPSSLELLSLLIDRGASVPVLILLSCRPTFQPPWEQHEHLSRLTLTRLPDQQVVQVAVGVTGGKPLPDAVLQQVTAKTDGVPLFVEEVTKMALESGLLHEVAGQYEVAGALEHLTIPPTLHDALMARLDRLGAAKTVAQLGAILGRRFPLAWLEAVSPLDTQDLRHHLGQLLEAQLLFRQGESPHTTYVFKHALIQEAAYQSILKRTRQRYHQHIAQVLETRFAELVETQPELLAYHYTEASCWPQAIPYWQRAGTAAFERSACLEAHAHFTRGMAVLEKLPDSPERLQYELDLQLAIGAVWQMTRGYGAPETEQAFVRARELCQQVGDSPRLLAALYGIGAFYCVRGDLATALLLGEQHLDLAQRLQQPVAQAQAHSMVGWSLFNLGELEAGRIHLERGVALTMPLSRHRQASSGGLNIQVLCRSSLVSRVLWALGYPDLALQQGHELRALAEALAHPHSIVTALGSLAMLRNRRREGGAAQELAEALLALATEQGFPLDVAIGMFQSGWALLEQGQAEQGMAQIQQSIAALRATGTRIGLVPMLVVLAEAYEKTGRLSQGYQALAEGQELMQVTGEIFWQAEWHRIRGALLLRERSQSTDGEQDAALTEAAAACFRQAYDLARRQRARSLALRAAMDLCRLRQPGSTDPVRALLAEVYDEFTEGWETPDLREARALLDA